MAKLPPILVNATLAIWAMAFAFWTADVFVEPVPFAIERAVRRLPLCLFGAALCLAIAPLLKIARRRSAAAALFAAMVALPIMSVLFASAAEIAYFVMASRWGPPALIHVADVAMLDFWVFLAWMLMFFALEAEQQRRDRELGLVRAEALASAAEHRLLVQQAQPHFLFNALNTVYALVLDQDLDAAKRALLALSGFLRRSLQHGPGLVTLEVELEGVRDFVAIEKYRFRERLFYEEDLSPQASNKLIPNLIIQPLVENCIKHGVNGSLDTVTITVSARLDDDFLIINVKDDAQGSISPVVQGIGLSAIKSRLAVQYDGAASLSLAPQQPSGFCAIIVVPAQ